MRSAIIFAVLAALAACSGPSELEQAAARHAFLERNGAPPDELCAAAKEAMDAAAAAQDDDEYRLWRLRSSTDCIEAQLQDMRTRAASGV